MLENIVWIMSYVTGLGVFLSSLVFGWLLLRNIITKFSYRRLLLGLGLIVVTMAYLYVDMSNIKLYPTWAITAVVAGFIFITLALAKKWWQYLLIPSLSLLYVFPDISRIIYYLSLFSGLALAYLAYENIYSLILEEKLSKDEVKNMLARSGWGLAFSALAVVSFSYTLMTMTSPSAPILLYQAMGIVAKIIFAVVLSRYLVHFSDFKRAERMVVSLSVTFITIVVSMNVILTFWAQEVLVKQLGEVVSSQIHATYELAKASYPDGRLVEMIQTRDPELLDYVDRTYASTKIKTTFFLGDERVAANPTFVNNKRPLGSRLGNEAVRSKVLLAGEEYTGQVFSNGQVLIAAYLPITDGDKVIGMIGTAREINHISSIERQLMIFYGVMAVCVIILATLAVIYIKPDRFRQ